jgi:S-adenosyl-L-methionine hydrolase (adenosine-forming)
MPLLTLTSDIGTQDYLVGAAKAQLLQINPGFSVIDISHNIPPFNYSQAAYVCRNTIINFPDYTYHIVLVNLFEKKPEQLLLAFHNNQYILCADNGLLSMIFDEKPELVIGIPFTDKEEKNTLYFVRQAGAVINKLVNGEPIKNIGIEDTAYLEKYALKPVAEDGYLEGQIVFIDNFENVIVNITRELFEKERNGRNFKIAFKRDEIIEKLSTTYADVPEGEILAFFNTAGYLEIAINKGNAAGLLGLKSYSEKNQQLSGIMQNRLFYQTVRVYFE